MKCVETKGMYDVRCAMVTCEIIIEITESTTNYYSSMAILFTLLSPSDLIRITTNCDRAVTTILIAVLPSSESIRINDVLQLGVQIDAVQQLHCFRSEIELIKLIIIIENRAYLCERIR